MNHFKIIDRSEKEDLFVAEGIEISIKKRFSEEVRTVFEEKSHLLNGDVFVSLFETESITDYISSKWRYDPSVVDGYEKINTMSGEEISNLFIEYIRNDTVPSWLEVSRFYTPEDVGKMFKMGSSMSDVEILDSLMFLDFDTIGGEHSRISLQRVTNFNSSGYQYNFKKGINWKEVILAVRERYELKKIPNENIDSAIAYAADTFIVSGLGLCHRKDLTFEVRKLASTSSSHKVFKSSVKKLLEENHISLNFDAGSSGGGFGGYAFDHSHSFNKAKFKIRRYNIVYAFEDNVEFDPDEMWTDLKTFEGDELWSAVFNALTPSLF